MVRPAPDFTHVVIARLDRLRSDERVAVVAAIQQLSVAEAKCFAADAAAELAYEVVREARNNLRKLTASLATKEERAELRTDTKNARLHPVGGAR